LKKGFKIFTSLHVKISPAHGREFMDPARCHKAMCVPGVGTRLGKRGGGKR